MIQAYVSVPRLQLVRVSLITEREEVETKHRYKIWWSSRNQFRNDIEFKKPHGVSRDTVEQMLGWIRQDI